MTTRTADRVDEWDSRPFSDGYEGLRTLADRSFSGAITAGRATLYMLNGTVVGILGGSIEDFEAASGTVYEAPTAALPLLAVMEERSEEVRAKYYSEETALSEADAKLSEGGFTGYIELSENVLSGDYYVVYHGGKSMSVAYVGESEQLITDEEAFEKADEEVGIYEVRPVEVEPIEIPESPDDDGDPSAAASGSTDRHEPDPDEQDRPESGSGEPTTATHSGATTDASDEQTTAEGSSARGSDTAEPASQANRSASEHAHDRQTTDTGDSAGTSEQRDDDDQPRGSTSERPRDSLDRESEQPSDSESATAPDDEPRRSSEGGAGESRRDGEPRQSRRSEARSPRGGERDGRARSSGRESDQQPPRRRSESVEDSRRADENRSRNVREPVTERRSQGESPERGRRERGRRSERSDVADAATEVAERAISEETSSGDTAELEHRTIPSVDPGRTWTPDENGSEQDVSSTGQSTGERTARRSAPSDTSAELETAQAEIEDLRRRIDELESERADLEAAREELATERDDLREERDQLQDDLERLRAERDELQAEIEEVRGRLAEHEEATETATAAETSLSPAQAIDGTNLFVRYESKGDATLKSAHGGGADAAAVDANLNLEYHTGFDATETAVDGRPFEAFLVDTIHYQFVDWVVRKLLYEIRDTGHQNALADLYDALPRIDRAELNGSVSVSVTEDGEERRTQEHFDVVLRDRMGNPLVVTNLNDSREAATDEMMTDLVTAATRVGESSDHLAGAFFLTSSFFDPGALETAAEASGGGILSRDKRESFVRLSRKDGFHLCLVESRDGGFHLAVPEL